MAHTSKKKKGKKKGEKRKSTRVFMILWLASALAFGVLLALWTQPSARMFSTLEIDPSGISVMMLFAGTWITGGLNLLIATGVLAASVMPFVCGMKGQAGARLYGSLLVVGLLAVGGAWWGLKRPMDIAEAKMEQAAPR